MGDLNAIVAHCIEAIVVRFYNDTVLHQRRAESLVNGERDSCLLV